MTKAEEMKLLDKIGELIKSAGDDSYIAMTFSGIVEIARSNIANDFGDSPAIDLADARRKIDELAKDAAEMSGELKKLKARYADLETAYLDAVDVIRDSGPHLHEAYNARMDRLQNMGTDETDAYIAEAYRAARRVKDVLQRGHSIVNLSHELVK